MAADIMEQLREQIPSVTEALQKIHDNPEQLKMGKKTLTALFNSSYTLHTAWCCMQCIL